MKWTIPDKPVKHKNKPKAGDTKLLHKFIFFPKSYWNFELEQTEWFWLQRVYLYYRYVEYEKFEHARWVREGVTDSFSTALDRGWAKI